MLVSLTGTFFLAAKTKLRLLRQLIADFHKSYKKVYDWIQLRSSLSPSLIPADMRKPAHKIGFIVRKESGGMNLQQC